MGVRRVGVCIGNHIIFAVTSIVAKITGSNSYRRPSLAFNSAVTETTSESPFFTNHSFEPTTMKEPRGKAEIAQRASVRADQIKSIHEMLQSDIQFLSYRSARYYNRKRDRRLTLKGGDKTELLRRNIRPKRLTNKLDYTKLGPFRIRRLRSLQITNCTRPQHANSSDIPYILVETCQRKRPIPRTPPGIDPDRQAKEYEV